jgi:hypothetical protein
VGVSDLGRSHHSDRASLALPQRLRIERNASIASVAREQRRLHERHEEMKNNHCATATVTAESYSPDNFSTPHLSLGSPVERRLLMRSFLKIKNPAVRSMILDMVSALAWQESQKLAVHACAEMANFAHGTPAEDRCRGASVQRERVGKARFRGEATTERGKTNRFREGKRVSRSVYARV